MKKTIFSSLGCKCWTSSGKVIAFIAGMFILFINGNEL